jgi:hypothetical protein
MGIKSCGTDRPDGELWAVPVRFCCVASDYSIAILFSLLFFQNGMFFLSFKETFLEKSA